VRRRSNNIRRKWSSVEEGIAQRGSGGADLQNLLNWKKEFRWLIQICIWRQQQNCCKGERAFKLMAKHEEGVI
jgi:hypothetical protein